MEKPKELSTAANESSTAAKESYCNSRYHFCVEFDPSILPMHEVSDNNDGIILYSNNKDISVTISGSLDILDTDTKRLYEDFIGEWMINNQDGRILYEVIKPQYYEVSFIDQDYQYYQKLYTRGDYQLIYQIEVPIDQQTEIDAIKNSLDISFELE